MPNKSLSNYIFNRVEFSGSLGDLGTLLPIAIAMIVLNGLNATNVIVTVGLFYIVVQSIGPVSTGIVLGIVGMVVTLLLLENRKVPAAVVVVPIVIIYLAWFIIGKVYSNRKDD
ncbi:MAG: putative sulfate/molybdate transporter [Deltaproteobacteria bacterium]|nr:putative sulfate/molybdate transporter [Deltaproteobacteria bacterium]